MHDNTETRLPHGATRCAAHVVGIPLVRQGWAPIPQDVAVSFTVPAMPPAPRDPWELQPC